MAITTKARNKAKIAATAKKPFEQKIDRSLPTPTVTPSVAKSYATGLKKKKKTGGTLKTAVNKRDYAVPENTVGLRTKGRAISKAKSKWDRY